MKISFPVRPALKKPKQIERTRLSTIIKITFSLRHLICLTAFAMAGVVGPLRAGQYFQDFSAFPPGATNFADGSQLFSTSLGSVAAVQDSTYHELQLTETGVSSVTSAFLLPDLDPNTPIYAFSVKWNADVSGSFPNAADGFSFNFGQLDSSNLTTGTVESGYPTGLCFSVQTYVGNNPGFYVRTNGVVAATLTNNPAAQWQTNSSTRHFFEVDWFAQTGLTVRLDGQTLFTNVPTTGFVPQAGRPLRRLDRGTAAGQSRRRHWRQSDPGRWQRSLL